MISFVSRNLKVFFRDKTAVFFSLLAVLIILGLYIEIEQNNMMCGVNTCLFMQAQKVILWLIQRMIVWKQNYMKILN